jgi:hypothetical protein
MKEIFKKVVLVLIVFSAFSVRSQTASDEVYYGPDKKEFNAEEYEKLKEEVDLIEEMEQKKLHEDSSQFGVGYGVEKGDNYTIYTYDSITGRGYYSEKHRGSGANNPDDGVQPNARENAKRKEYQRRAAYERVENRKRQIEENRLKRKKEDSWRDNPRSEEINKNRSSGGGFFKFLLIIVIAIILGAAAYMLFVNAPMEGSSTKILYHQEMNPDSVQLSELEIKIKEAKESKDYRVATRLYFVWVIKELSDKGYINWKKRKTNYHYYLELGGKSFSEDFGIGVKNYEFIWYGKYDVVLDEFNVVEKHFKELISKIK